MKFNEKIVRLRKTKGMTQDELAQAVGVSRQAVYKWECGQSYPEVVKLLELKLLFGISIDDLLDEAFEVAAPEKKKRKRVVKPVAETEAITETKEEKVPEVKDEVTLAEPVAEEPVAEGEVVPEEKTETEAPTIDNITEEPKKTEKKRGFFARLFGRK